MPPADTQIAMLTELVRRGRADEEGRILMNRDFLVESLERIRHDHQRELQMLPEVAGRLVEVLA